MNNLLLIQPKAFLKKIFPKAIWNFNRHEKIIYLTFDDGPILGVTEWVLEELRQYKAKATFFCVGANVQKHPSIFAKIIADGHRIGNHTMHHIKGFKTSKSDYLKEVEECKKLVPGYMFRPPYGQLKPNQYKALIKLGYTIVMWDVVSYDYEAISPKRCYHKVKQNTKSGSVVLFHDSIKAEKNMKFALSELLRTFSQLGYRFESIPDSI